MTQYFTFKDNNSTGKYWMDQFDLRIILRNADLKYMKQILEK